MPPRVHFPRFMAMSERPRVLFLLDSFAYLRAAWGRECYVQQVLEHLFYAGTIAIAVVLGGARVIPGDYERMFESASLHQVAISCCCRLHGERHRLAYDASRRFTSLGRASLLQLCACFEHAEVSL